MRPIRSVLTLSMGLGLAGVASAQGAGIFDPAFTEPGKPHTMTGQALWSQQIGAAFGVLLELPPRGGVRQHYLFRVTDAKGAEVKAGMTVTLSGRFFSRRHFEKENTVVYTFDEARVTELTGTAAVAQPEMPPMSQLPSTGASPPSGEAPIRPGEPAAERPAARFDGPLMGWRLKGTVNTKEGLTAVFTREERTRYVRQGAFLEPGLRVVGVTSTGVRLRREGETFDAMPW